jgi:hypothetical protein
MLVCCGFRSVVYACVLWFLQWGVGRMAGEVGLLSRRIVLKGDTSTVGTNEDSFGGHVLVRAASSAEVVGVQFTKMGQAGVMVRCVVPRPPLQYSSFVPLSCPCVHCAPV